MNCTINSKNQFMNRLQKKLHNRNVNNINLTIVILLLILMIIIFKVIYRMCRFFKICANLENILR